MDYTLILKSFYRIPKCNTCSFHTDIGAYSTLTDIQVNTRQYLYSFPIPPTHNHYPL